ncbi:F-box protein At1g19070 [Linum grandiflorum]
MSIEEATSCSSAEPERISSLAEDVKLHILSFLPLKGAAMSSILSTQWRNLWTYLPTLALHNREIKPSSDFILKLLTSHRGPLREFSLSLSRNSAQDVDFSLYTLISQQNYVENDEFVISILKSIERHRLITNAILHLLPRPTITSLNINYLDSRRNIPMWSKMLLIMRMSIISLFSRLKTLRLSYCILINSTPVSFHRCFENLTVLELRHVKFPPNSAHWKFGCPLLTTLSLDGYRIELGSDDELSLISWLLNSSPALEQIEIEVFDENLSRNVDSQIVNSVNGFRRVSSKVEINITSAI